MSSPCGSACWPLTITNTILTASLNTQTHCILRLDSVVSDRTRRDTTESQVDDRMLVEEDYAADHEEDDYFNYSENLALNDALHDYC